MIERYEFDDLDRALLKKIKVALKEVRRGEPLRDFMDEDDVLDALTLLQIIGKHCKELK